MLVTFEKKESLAAMVLCILYSILVFLPQLLAELGFRSRYTSETPPEARGRGSGKRYPG